MPIGWVAAGTFLVVWLLLASSMVYFAIEGISAFAMRLWAFRHGPLVFRERRPSLGLQRRTNGTQLTRSGRFRVVGPNVIVFCFGRSWFGLRFRTPMPIKGTIVWRDGFAEISGRMPVGAILVPSFWLLTATVWSFIAALSVHGDWRWLWVIPAAGVFAFVSGPVFLPLEKRRALKVADEVLQVA